jgi:hypothetical protein
MGVDQPSTPLPAIPRDPRTASKTRTTKATLKGVAETDGTAIGAPREGVLLSLSV